MELSRSTRRVRIKEFVIGDIEVLVHLEVDVDEFPDDYVSVEIDVSDILNAKVFQDEIDIYNIAETRARGDKWLTSAQTAVFDVPSAVVPKERNICLSPTHPVFQAIETVEVAPFQFDPRLFDFG
jgi:RES domain-containing protein